MFAALNEFRKKPIQVAAAIVGLVVAILGIATNLLGGDGGGHGEAGTSSSAERALSASPSSASGGQVPEDLSPEESEVALVVQQAQAAFQEGNAGAYCNTRTVSFLEQAYGGGYPYATCVKAGETGLKAERPAILNGPRLDIRKVEIEGGSSGTEAAVDAEQNGAPIKVRVRRLPPGDDVWRVARFSGG